MKRSQDDIWVRAPSNIALIKYMGKSVTEGNLPANSSLSMTLDRLCTLACVRLSDSSGLRWLPELFSGKEQVDGMQALIPSLSDKGRERILRHVQRVLEQAPSVLKGAGLSVHLPAGLSLAAANTFPAASGIASSASSFAAVTLAVAAALAEDPALFWREWDKSSRLREGLAVISRQGSGSSCRSMQGPFVRWSEEQAHAVVGTTLQPLVDLVLLAGREEKEVSSSEAHKRVLSSPLWAGRTSRAESRVGQVEQLLREGDWNSLTRLVWQESMEMHSLFHTSEPPFTYWLPRSLEIIRGLSQFISVGAGPAGLPAPLVTMDAGPNVHVLVPADSAAAWKRELAVLFPGLDILEDRAGRGAGAYVRGGLQA